MSESSALRNGTRTTSTASIYDYPEHLNPFYEDDNHARIRFWKIGKGKGNNGLTRTGSFSFDGFKNMWAFKSFRLKKKSSTLGINKTSESPPSLRKLESNETNYGTYDPRLRHTVGVTGLNSNFQRNVPYRSSMQDMRTSPIRDSGPISPGIGLNRNYRYRSTLQATPTSSTPLSSVSTPRRYVYGGSHTPQPTPRRRSGGHSQNPNSNKSELEYATIPATISRGSSSASVAINNPFEDEDDADIVIKKLEINGTNSGTPAKRPGRKKRRAPAPPVPIPQIIAEEPGKQEPGSPEISCIQLRTNEKNLKSEDISNLTNEIQKFVQRKSEEQDIVVSKIYSSDGNEKVEILDVDKLGQKDCTINESDVHSGPELKVVKVIQTKNNCVNSERSKDRVILNANVSERVDQFVDFENDLLRKELANKYVNVKSIDGKEKVDLISTAGEDQSDLVPQSAMYDEKQNFSHENHNESFTSDDFLPIPILELKITEPKDDVVNVFRSSNVDDEKKSEKIINGTSNGNIILDEHLAPQFSTTDSSAATQVDDRKMLSKESSTGTLERRRSVKDIIASINRNQSLLKVNHDGVPTPHPNPTINNLNCKEFIRPPPRKSSLNYLVKYPHLKNVDDGELDIVNTVNNNKSLNAPSQEPADGDKNNNNDIFKKCILKKELNREVSPPTASNLDWNPVPKPKRSKNLKFKLETNEKSGN